MSKESISKVYFILEKIDYIEQIVNNSGSITRALEDSITQRPAILMQKQTSASSCAESCIRSIASAICITSCEEGSVK